MTRIMDPFLTRNLFSNILDDPVTELKVPEPESKRDDIYYFDYIVFKVEDTLFRVPKNGFQIVQQEGTMVEGSDDSCPLPLHGISKAYFRSFLRVLYPINGTVTTYEEWVGALDLATLWDFKEIRKTSVGALSRLVTSRDVVEVILLAKKYRVKQWLQDGYLKLIQQAELLNIDELRSSNVDLLTIARLWSVYGMIMAHRLEANNNFCQNCRNNDYSCSTDITDNEANPLITRIFADEFREIDDVFPPNSSKKHKKGKR